MSQAKQFVVYESYSGYRYAPVKKETEHMVFLDQTYGERTIRKDRVIQLTGNEDNARNIRDKLNQSHKQMSHLKKQADEQHRARVEKIMKAASE